MTCRGHFVEHSPSKIDMDMEAMARMATSMISRKICVFSQALKLLEAQSEILMPWICNDPTLRRT